MDSLLNFAIFLIIPVLICFYSLKSKKSTVTQAKGRFYLPPVPHTFTKVLEVISTFNNELQTAHFAH